MVTVSYRGSGSDPKKRSRTKTLGKILPGLALTLTLITLVMVHTWQQSRMVSLKQEEFSLIQEWTRLEILNEQLRSELATLRSLDRIDRIARKELGLVTPLKTKTIVLPPKPDR